MLYDPPCPCDWFLRALAWIQETSSELQAVNYFLRRHPVTFCQANLAFAAIMAASDGRCICNSGSPPELSVLPGST